MHTPLSQAFPGMPASITVRFLLAKHRKQKNRGFFQALQRKDFSDTVYCNQCRLSYCNTNRKLPLARAKSSKPRREEKRLELQLLLRRLHIHSQPGSSKKGIFQKKAFCLGMAKTMIVDNLCGIINRSFKKTWLNISVLSFPCLPMCPFHEFMCYVFWRSGENGPGVEGPSSPDRVNGP